MIDRTGEIADVGARAAVGFAGASYTYMGLPMSDWVGIVTIVYLAVSTIKNIPGAVDTLIAWRNKWRKNERR